MDFNIGNLVSAVEGGIAKVANAVVNTVNSVISGITEMVKSVFGVVESALDGAMAMIGVVDSDGDGNIDFDYAEEFLEEKYKAFVGAIMGIFDNDSSGATSSDEAPAPFGYSRGTDLKTDYYAAKDWVEQLGLDVIEMFRVGALNKDKQLQNDHDIAIDEQNVKDIEEYKEKVRQENEAQAPDKQGFRNTECILDIVTILDGATGMIGKASDKAYSAEGDVEKSSNVSEVGETPRETEADSSGNISGNSEVNMAEESSETTVGTSDAKKFGTDYFNEEYRLDPVNAVTGSLYIPSVDIVLPDINDEFKIERKYQSINSRLGVFGIGWTNNFETYLKILGGKVEVLCSDGHIETFNKIDDEWINSKGGTKRYYLKQEKSCWTFKSFIDKKIYRYNNTGKLIDITDKNNSKLSITYIGENIETIQTFSNYKLFVTYYDGKIIEIKDELNRAVQYKYNGDYLTKVIHVNQGVTKYTYDEKGYISSITDQNGNTYTKNFFDKKGRVIRQEYPNGDFSIATYNEAERKNIFYYNGSQRKEITIYNKENLITCNVYEDGSVQEYRYDEYKNKIYIKDRNGFETHKVYDEFSNLLKETLPNGLVSEYTYDENGNLIKQIDNTEKEIIYIYDSKSNLTEKKTKITDGNWKIENYTYDSLGRICSKTDGNGNTSKYEYDHMDRLISIKNPLGIVEKIIRDSEGNVIKEVNPNYYNDETKDGIGVEYVYDKENRLISVQDKYGSRAFYKYDCLNKKTYERFKINDTTTKIIHYVYDKVGNLVEKREEINGGFISPEDKGKNIWAVTKYKYDKNGNITKIITPKGYEIGRVYDEIDRIIKQVLPEQYDSDLDDGVGTTYSYNLKGKVVEVKNALGEIITKNTYDPKGNLKASIDGENNIKMIMKITLQFMIIIKIII